MGMLFQLSLFQLSYNHLETKTNRKETDKQNYIQVNDDAIDQTTMGMCDKKQEYSKKCDRR